MTMRKLIFVVLALSLTGCSTPYQEMGLLGGVNAARIDEHTAQIRAQGNGYTAAATIETYVVLRAAEETLKDGYDGFQILGAQDATSVAVTPGVVVASGTTIAYMPAMGVPMPGGVATIIMLKQGDPAWTQHHTYIAADVEKYLGASLRKKGS
jgi:hypothetical protein